MDVTEGSSAAVLEADWADRARQASYHFCVLEKDVNSPMTDASLARIFFRHVPMAVEMDAAGAEGSKGDARMLSRALEQDLVVGRDFDSWLAGFNHLPSGTREMFAVGSANSLNPIFDRLADIGGYQRSDVLVKEMQSERGRVVSIESRMRHASERAAAMRALGMDGPGC